jgi:hypothetical protein
LIATGQIGLGDVIKIDLSVEGDRMIFSKERVMTSFGTAENTNVVDFPHRRANKVGARIPSLEPEVANYERGSSS